MAGKRPGVIADDITGALLIAGVLEARGHAAPVFFAPEHVSPGGDVTVLATRARLEEPEVAARIIREGAAALQRAGAGDLAYKACASFDSTPRGNIGLAAEILSELAGGAPVVLNAGFPKFRATVHQGYLFYRTRLVSESVKSTDPLTPMSDPDLVRFLSLQTQSPVGLISHLVLAEGPEATLSAFDTLRAAGHRHILTDCSDDQDVAQSLALALARDAVVVASDPLIIAYAAALSAGPSHDQSETLPRISGPGAVLVGSAGPTAEAQTAAFIAAGHEVCALDLLADEAAELERVLAWGRARLSGRPFAIITAPDAAAVARAQAALGQMPAARRAERLIGAIAQGLVAAGLRRLVVSGGETSGAVVAALGLTSVRALPETTLGSGFCLSQGAEPLSLFFKSGKLGDGDIFARALDQMSGH